MHPAHPNLCPPQRCELFTCDMEAVKRRIPDMTTSTLLLPPVMGVLEEPPTGGEAHNWPAASRAEAHAWRPAVWNASKCPAQGRCWASPIEKPPQPTYSSIAPFSQPSQPYIAVWCKITSS